MLLTADPCILLVKWPPSHSINITPWASTHYTESPCI